MLAALLIAAVQGPALEVTTSLDRARVAVGEEVVFTLRAVGHSTAAFRVDLPALDGFALAERQEATEVVYGARQLTRAYTLELRLRAEQVGTWSIGAIRVEQGDASGFSTPETVTVINASSGPAGGLGADLLALVPKVPSPRAGGPSVFVVLSAESVFAGDEVDVLTAAWLPRGLRLRLRQPPTLTPPALPGVWATPRPAIPGVVASRVVEGESYDLFVGFQTVYPLNPGTMPIPTARLAWMQPSGRQFFSDAERQAVESPPVTLEVRPLPVAGRPAGFDGPVARDLHIEYRLGQPSARSGSALTVEVLVTGDGNLPLWPAPRVSWPAGVRVYDEGTEGTPRLEGGRLGGTRRYRYAVVPDSAGSLALPPLEYPWFDPGGGAYRIARSPGIVVPVLEPVPVADRRTPVPVEELGPREPAQRLLELPWPALAGLVAAPVVLLLGTALVRRRRIRPTALSDPRDPATRLADLLGQLLPAGARAAPPALTAALREAGVERALAAELVALQVAVEAQRFGPGGAGGATPELSRAIAAALGKVPGRMRRPRTRARRAAVLLAVLAAPPARVHAQGGDPIDLYASGNYAAAAEGFRRNVAVLRPSGVMIYDLAASEYMLRQDARAAASLIAARALAPRDPQVQALWSALAREHQQLRQAPPAWPVTADELLALGLVLLWAGALAGLLPRRVRWLSPAVLALAGLAAAAGLAGRSDRRQPRAILTAGASLRLSPHGLAPERGTAGAFTVLELERREAGWWLVRTAQDLEGWVPEEIVARVPALD